MNANFPRVSVIIPTHNRCASLERTLHSLARQNYPFNDFEVVVIADGCTDTTVEMLQSRTLPFSLRIGQQRGLGASAARNHGARIASGSLLLFLDDDVEATPLLLEAHVRAHSTHPSRVVMGPYYPVKNAGADFIGINVRLWWHKKFETLQELGHRYTFRDLLSGNLSMEANLFARIGGFDPTIQSAGGEDYELGVRLLKAEIPFCFVPNALAHHHESMNLARSFKRARQEGFADIHIGRRHPELRPTLLLADLAETSSLKGRIAQSLAFQHTKIGDVLAAVCFLMLRVLERIHFHTAWQRLFRQVRKYWYLRGVGQEIKSRSALVRFLQGGPAHGESCGHEIEIDLVDGVEAAERRLDYERPSGLRIRYRHHVVGHIPAMSGAETLRGAHLRPLLAKTELAWRLMRAIIWDGAMIQRPVLANGRDLGK